MTGTVPVYILTGFLDSGKTTFLNGVLRDRPVQKRLILQFEEGEVELEPSGSSKQVIWTLEAGAIQDAAVRHEVAEEIANGGYEEIWIEWNGMAEFSDLEALLLEKPAGPLVHIEKVFYIADVTQANLLLGQTGEGPVSQLAGSDVAFWHHASDKRAREDFLRKKNSVAPGIRCRSITKKNVEKELDKKVRYSIGWILGSALLLLLLVMGSSVKTVLKELPFLKTATIFMGIFLQAMPFLLLGILLASAIQIFLPQDLVERLFAGKRFAGVLIGLIAGFFLPVCDCASIPVFKGLIKKGVSLPAAVCFMMAAPVINPVVMLSTYYAWGCSWQAVLYRTGAGMLCAFLIGCTFFIRKPEDFLKEEIGIGGICTCGCYLPAGNGKGAGRRMEQFLVHSRNEFYSVAKYLLAGIAISACMQQMNLSWLQGGAIPAKALLSAMLLAFLLSLCSSSDAVVAKNLTGQFTFFPILGFLVFGPMMDLKNVILLHSYFKKTFILRLVITVLLVCFGTILLLGMVMGDVKL